jgi:RNA-directed DNA polymerase
VVQTAAKLILEPIFEADFDASAYGYRPRRTAQDAVREVHESLCQGYTDVVDADLSKYFDTIPHHELMLCVARRVVDREMLKLIKAWLKVPVEERDERGNRRMTGGKKSRCGTPQGGVISPLLANLYMHRFLKAWRRQGKDRAYVARIVNYADDFVILSRGHAKKALEWTRRVMTAIGLTLNETKTCIREAQTESFNFLGYTFGPERYRKDGHWYQAAQPSEKAIKRLKEKVNAELHPGNHLPWDEAVGHLNAILRGWAAYFSYGTRLMAYRAIDAHVLNRVRHFLRRRHKVSSRGTRRFSDRVVFGPLGVQRLRTLHVGSAPCAMT